METNVTGNLMEAGGVLSWIKSQKNDQSIEEVNRETLFKYIESKEFLAVMFCKSIKFYVPRYQKFPYFEHFT
jgi:hypothetical protein